MTAEAQRIGLTGKITVRPPKVLTEPQYLFFIVSMRSAITIVALTATARGAAASPILEDRQMIPGNGSMTLYSGPGCRASDVLAQDVAIVSGCTTLDTPVDSVLFHGGTGWPLGWNREIHPLYLLSEDRRRPELKYAQQ